MTERPRPGEGPGNDGGSAGLGGRARHRWPRVAHPAMADGGRETAGLFAATPDPAIRYAVDGDTPSVVDLNEAYAGVFDVDPSATGPLETRLRTDLDRGTADGDPADDDVVEDHAADGVVGALVADAAAGSSHGSVLRVDATGGERDYLARVVPAPGDRAVGDGFVVLTDVTDQRERTRELATQRDRLDEFASIVSHDLRNPLEVAEIQLEAARDRGDDVHFEKVAEALERMERIVEDVLALSRQGAVVDDVEPAALSGVAEAAWDAVAAPEATMRVEDDVVLAADEARLQELLENLFRNATEHAGPAVTVTVGRTDDGFHVADDGPGIPGEDRGRVFESGVSTDDGGTGLGLSIVERIASAHGWDVSIATAASGGARFDFSGVDLRSQG